jgi:hypothetical protein
MATSPSEPPVPPEVIGLAVALALTDTVPPTVAPPGPPDPSRWRWAEFEPPEGGGWTG